MDDILVDDGLDFEAILVAGGGSASGAVEIGTVKLHLEGGVLTVTYDASQAAGDSRDDWSIEALHFDFGEVGVDIPVTRKGLPVLGGFDFGGGNVELIENDPSRVEFRITDFNPNDLTNWAAHATVSQRSAVDAFNESLPDQVKLRFVDFPSLGDTSYLKTEVISSSEEWLKQTFDGWCVDVDRRLALKKEYTANVYSSIGDDLTGIIDKPENMDCVNWLLNNQELLVGKLLFDEVAYQGAGAASADYPRSGEAVGTESDWMSDDPTKELGIITYADIQRAIWGLIDDKQSTVGLAGWSSARADELADRAFLYGQGYEPACDDKAAVVFEPIDTSGRVNGQVTIGQVTIISPNGTCEGREETAWAITGGIEGLGGDTQFGSSWAEYNVFGSTSDSSSASVI
jgi:hypothetical protein